MSFSSRIVVPCTIVLAATGGTLAWSQPTPAPILEVDGVLVENYLFSMVGVDGNGNPIYESNAQTNAQHARPYQDQRGTGLDGSLRSAAPFGWKVNANPYAHDWNEKARYRDVIMLQTGRYSPTEIDMALPAPGFSWTIGRTYTVPEDTPTYTQYTNVPQGYQGLDWHQFSQPEIRHIARPGEDYIYLVYGADRFVEFKQLNETSSVYRGVNGAAGAFVEGVSGSHDTLTYWDQNGTRSTFFDPRDPDNNQSATGHDGQGQLWTIVDAAGNQASVGHATDPVLAIDFGYDAEGRMQTAYDTAGRKYEYSYTEITSTDLQTPVPTATFLTKVEVFEDYDTDSIWETTGSKVEYTYHSQFMPGQGIFGNLEEVHVTVPLTGYVSSSPTQRTQVMKQRYWHHPGTQSGGRTGYFAARVNAEGYRRFENEQVADIQQMSTTSSFLPTYLEYLFKYHAYTDTDGNEHGKAKYVSWGGRPNGSLLSTDFKYFDYATYPSSKGADNAYSPEHQRFVEVDEQSKKWNQYFDEAGQPLSEVVFDLDLTSGSIDMWTFVVRNDPAAANVFDGLIWKIARPLSIETAVNNPSGATYIPPCTLKANAGGIEIYARDNGVSSAFRGFTLASQWQIGQTPLAGDGPHSISSFSYLTPVRDGAAAVDVGGYLVIRPLLSQIKRYPGVDLIAGVLPTEDTTYTYEFHAEAVGGGGVTDPADPLWLRYRRETTSLPIVSTAQLGSGIAETYASYHRPDGTVAYARDESGIWDYYQIENGLVTKDIEDADLSLTSAFAVGEAPGDYMVSVPSTASAYHLVTSQVRDEIGRSIEITHPSGRVQEGYHSSIASGEFTEVWSAKSTGIMHMGPASYYAYDHLGVRFVDAEIAFAGGSTTVLNQSGWLDEAATSPLGDAVAVGTLSRVNTVIMSRSGALMMANRSYHTLPESGVGVRRYNFDEEWYVYDDTLTVTGVVKENGTVVTQDYDSFGNPKTTWIDSYDPGEGIIETFASNDYGQVPEGCRERCCLEVMGFPGPYGIIMWFAKGCTELHLNGIGDPGLEYAQGDILGRRVFTITKDLPHEFREYDNLGRLIAVGTYSDIPTNHFTVKTQLPTEDTPDQPDIFDDFDSRDDSPRLISQNRLSLVEYKYTPQGELWKATHHEVNQNTGLLEDSVQSVYAYDESGRLIYINSGRITKRSYSRLGQLSDTYTVAVTDDAAGSYSDLFGVDGDVVVSENHVAINHETGNTHLHVRVDREPDISGQPQAVDQLDLNNYSDHTNILVESTKLHGRAQITTYEFDLQDRIVSRSIHGTGSTDSGSDFNPASPPSGAIATALGYGDDGRVETVTDGLGRVQRMGYNLAGKLAQQIDNYALGGTAVDENRKTEWVYRDTLLLEYIAYVDDTTKQVTSYDYGAPHTDPRLPGVKLNPTNDHLRSIVYPDGKMEEFFYDLNGTLAYYYDRNQNRIKTTFDTADRPVIFTFDVAGAGYESEFGREVELGYNNRGKISSVFESANDGGTVFNTVSLEYDGWGVLSVFRQQDDFLDSLLGGDGSVVKERAVGYTWESSNSGSPSTLRLGEFGYLGDVDPLADGDEIGLAFNYTGSTNSGLSRVASMVLDGVTVANYEYLGLDRISKVSYPENDVYSNLQNASNTYDALDRYNRVTRSRWNRTRATNEVPFYDNEVHWDDGSNVTGITDHVFGDDFNFKFVNDELDRLTQSKRGAGTGTLITNLREQADWDLGKVGTWNSYSLDLGDDLDYSDDGEFQADNSFDGATPDLSINQLTTIQQDTDNTPGYEENFDRTYDDNGNLKSAPDRNQKFKWDYLGRLIEVTTEEDVGGGVMVTRQVAEFKYNALGYRIAERFDSNGDEYLDRQVTDGGNGDDTIWRRLIYDAQWRVVEVYEIETATGSEIERLTERHVHHGAGLNGVGTGSYIDSVVLRDRDTDGNSENGFEERHYYCQNWRQDVVAVINAAGRQVEQMRYTAYGTPYAIPFVDQNLDGFLNFFDISLVQAKVGAGVYDVTVDGNLDGLVNFFDLSYFLQQNTVLTGQDMGRDVQSTYGHNRGYAGYWRVDELKLSHVRYRWYDAGNGTWISKDPAGYVDGGSLYGYVAGGPIIHRDPMGLDLSGIFDGAGRGIYDVLSIINTAINSLGNKNTPTNPNSTTGYTESSDKKTVYHRHKTPDARKFVQDKPAPMWSPPFPGAPDGVPMFMVRKEVVFDKRDSVVTDPADTGTVNLGHNYVTHTLFDVVRYWIFGTCIGDRTPVKDRIFGPPSPPSPPSPLPTPSEVFDGISNPWTYF